MTLDLQLVIVCNQHSWIPIPEEVCATNTFLVSACNCFFFKLFSFVSILSKKLFVMATLFRNCIKQTLQYRSLNTLSRLKQPISVAPMVDITTPVS